MLSKNNKRKFNAVNSLHTELGNEPVSLPNYNYTNILPKYDNDINNTTTNNTTIDNTTIDNTTINNTITNNTNDMLFNYIVNTTNDSELKNLISKFNNMSDVINNLNTIKKLCIHYTTIGDDENILKLLFVIIDYNYNINGIKIIDNLSIYYNYIYNKYEKTILLLSRNEQKNYANAMYNLTYYYSINTNNPKITSLGIIPQNSNNRIFSNDKSPSLILGVNSLSDDSKNMLTTEKKKKKLFWLTKAAELDHIYAMNDLGAYYYKIKKDYDNAVFWWMKTIKFNDSRAMYNMSIYYINIEKNYDQAIFWLTKAAELNTTEAMLNLGYYYFKIKKNYEKSIFWWIKAAELGCIKSIINLGKYYFNVEKNTEIALLYYHKAAEANNIRAIDFLIKYYTKGT